MFCRIYLCFKAGDSELWTQELAAVINARVENERYIEKDGLLLEIRLNEDRDRQKAKEFPNGFLHFPYSIEIEAEYFSTHQTSVVDDLNKILNYLWNTNNSAVASCSFENLLVKGGGYKRRDIPWC